VIPGTDSPSASHGLNGSPSARGRAAAAVDHAEVPTWSKPISSFSFVAVAAIRFALTNAPYAWFAYSSRTACRSTLYRSASGGVPPPGYRSCRTSSIDALRSQAM